MKEYKKKLKVANTTDTCHAFPRLGEDSLGLVPDLLVLMNHP